MMQSLSTAQQPDGTYLVSGNTFPIKDTLRKQGGTWDAGRKAWIMPQEFDPISIKATAVITPTTSLRGATTIGVSQDDDYGEEPLTIDTSPATRSKTKIPRGEVMLISSVGTFKIKDRIVKAGGRWKPETKQWEVPIDFDMSIIPKAEEKTKTTTFGSQAAENSETFASKVPRVIHCGLCGKEGHTRNKCQCSNCGTIGLHIPEQCPTIHPRWKFLVQHDSFRCTCSASKLCDTCVNVCCRDAIATISNNLLKSKCDKHGEKCIGRTE
jgi:hypothetical protein